MAKHISLCLVLLCGLASLAACEPSRQWTCTASAGSPDFLQELGCHDDFKALASEPLNSNITGTQSVKVVIDQLADDAVYFQNSKKYKLHWDFASKHLSGQGKPIVLPLSQFSQIEYYSPSRRFVLGSLLYYSGPKAWVFEISPWDTATAALIEKAYRILAQSTYFGKQLYFHPTSLAVEQESKKLPKDIQIITTNELFEGTEFQALNLGVSYGRLRFYKTEELEKGEVYVSFRDIVVLDTVPNDISVTAGIITAEFQTPLSHINVLSQNRGTPNMALRKATTHEQLVALKDKWVKLEVKALSFSISEVSQAEADQWWQKNKPSKVQVPALDLEVKELRDIKQVLDPQLELGPALAKAIPAFGGKASHYGAMASIGDDVPAPKAFAIPVYFYDQFMKTHGFLDRLKAMLADDKFLGDPKVRDQSLQKLRDDMLKAPLDAEFLKLVEDKLRKEYPDTRMRFRSSTNAEDLGGFTGAGLYTSQSGELSDPKKPIADAIRTVWSSVWFFRAFEERSYRSIDHLSVGMALLVHRSFPDEEANGVALTANPFDTSGLEPGFYINVQKGESSVVQPAPGVTTDQFIYQFDRPGQPIIYITHSSLLPKGDTVLTPAQVFKLGTGLAAIHKYFYKLYGQDDKGNPKPWYAMDVEFKFDGEKGKQPQLFIKQARPHPGRGKRAD